MIQTQEIVESQPTVMDISRGPLVDITPEQRTEFRKTGELPNQVPPVKEESAPSDPPKEAEADAGDPPPPLTTQERTERDKAKATKRFNEILEENKTLKAQLEAKKPIEQETKPKAEPIEPQPTRPKPKPEGNGPNGKPYETYEDYIDDLTDWKGEQREAKNQREAIAEAQVKAARSKVDEAKTRYENFNEVVGPAFEAIVADQRVDPVVKTMLDDSELFADLMYTIGSDKETLESFVKMARETPGKAIRYIALTESLIAEELEGKKTAKPADEETPAKPKTAAPKPPAEAGGRAATPPDALESAAKANDFRSFKAEATRRQLAKLKG